MVRKKVLHGIHKSHVLTDLTPTSRCLCSALFWSLCGLIILSSSVSQAEDLSSDPLEDYNRAVFWFNDQVDQFFFEPVAKGYDAVVPNSVQESVDNFFVNLRTPIYLVSDLVQLKPAQFANHYARFMLNTTLGIVGLFDVAESWFKLEHKTADFGIALGSHGVGPGAYFVIPFLGPSTLRDGFGRLVDAFLNPTFYIGETGASGREAFLISGGLYLVDSINSRAALLDAVDTAKEASLDYYLFVRSAYGQYREKQITGVSEKTEDDEFNFDDEPAAQ